MQFTMFANAWNAKIKAEWQICDLGYGCIYIRIFRIFNSLEFEPKYCLIVETAFPVCFCGYFKRSINASHRSFDGTPLKKTYRTVWKCNRATIYLVIDCTNERRAPNFRRSLCRSERAHYSYLTAIPLVPFFPFGLPTIFLCLVFLWASFFFHTFFPYIFHVFVIFSFSRLNKSLENNINDGGWSHKTSNKCLLFFHVVTLWDLVNVPVFCFVAM